MRNFNRATVIGNVGSDVVLRYTKSGKPVVNLSIATNERRKEGPEITTWHRIVLWDRLAELAHKYVRKGESLYVEGPLSHNEWVDNNGVARSRSEITAREMIFLSSRGANNDPDILPSEETINSQTEDGEEIEEISESIPF